MYQKFKSTTIASMVAEPLALLASGKANKIAVPLDPHWNLDLRSQSEPFPATVANLQVYFFDGDDPTDSYNFVDSSFVVPDDATYVAELIAKQINRAIDTWVEEDDLPEDDAKAKLI